MTLITSRDFEILLLYRCLRHFHTEHELRTIFHHFNFSQKRSKRLRLHFLNIFSQTKIFFLTHLLYAKSTFNTDRKLYKKKWCDQMRTWFNFHWKTDSLFDFHRWLSRKALIKLSEIVVAKTLCWENNYSIFKTTRNWINLFLINDFVNSFAIIWSVNT